MQRPGIAAAALIGFTVAVTGATAKVHRAHQVSRTHHPHKREAVKAGANSVPQIEMYGLTIRLVPDVPFDLEPVNLPDPKSLNNLQRAFDILSWRTFIALDWPADRQGNPDRRHLIGRPARPAVWEAWKQNYEVFRADGGTPTAWGAPHDLPADFSPEARAEARHVGKSVFEFEQPLESGPLVDRDGRYVRYEILLNRDLFDYVVSNNLYTPEGQERFTQSSHVVLPCGNIPKQVVGAIVVKPAWKVLNATEIRNGRYYMRDAVLLSPREGNRPEQRQRAKIGLVGLHIIHKSDDVAQWTWSTFEQEDNVPTAGAPISASAHFNFFSPGVSTPPVNTPSDRPWHSMATEPAARRAQLTRMIPLTAETRYMNGEMHKLLRMAYPHSVWQHYELISTQWPTQPARTSGVGVCDVMSAESAQVDPTGAPAPVFLGNMTLESFIPGEVPNVSSSCMECHMNATTTNAKYSDFSFLFQKAHSPALPVGAAEKRP